MLKFKEYITEYNKIIKNIDIVYKSPEGTVSIPKTSEAYDHLSKGTKWASTFNKGGIQIIVSEEDKNRFMVQNSKVYDINGKKINFKEFLKKYPWINFKNVVQK